MEKLDVFSVTDKIQYLINSSIKLPEYSGDEICPECNLCDGYGHIIQGNSSRNCPNFLKRNTIKKILEVVENNMGNFEDWPPLSFHEERKKSGFIETLSFRECEKIFCNIKNNMEPRGIVLLGGHGRSKTLASLILIKECIDIGIPAIGVNFPGLVYLLKKGIEGQRLIDRKFNIIDQCKVLFVDEVGREFSYGNPEHSFLILQEIVNYCYKRKFLVIASNKSKSDFREYLKSDISSRLNPKSTYCNVIEEDFNAIDLRIRR